MGSYQSLVLPRDEGRKTGKGYHVLQVHKDSPASRAGLKDFFDIIVAIGEKGQEPKRLIDDNREALKKLLNAIVERPTRMTVFNTRTRTMRNVEVIPSNKWGGEGLLGVSIQFSSFSRAYEHPTWHVLEVFEGGPAAVAGLQAHFDYIIGADCVLEDREISSESVYSHQSLFTLIDVYEGSQLHVLVYNLLTNCSRRVALVPNCNWGGAGSLGCVLAYGYLHRIPITSYSLPDLLQRVALSSESENKIHTSLVPKGQKALAVT